MKRIRADRLDQLPHRKLFETKIFTILNGLIQIVSGTILDTGDIEFHRVFF